MIFGSIASKWPLSDLKDQFKDRLIPTILTQYGFSYDRNAYDVNIDDYREILPSYDYSYVEDHFWGQHRAITMSVAELKLERDGDKRTYTVFDGLVCCFDYPKSIASDVVVKSDHGAVSRFFFERFSRANRVKLEDPRFETVFDVYCDDQVGARYILTPMVMDRLVALERIHPGVRAVFRQDKVYLALPGRLDLFKTGSFFRPLNRGIIYQFRQDMKLVIQFVGALKLDAETKI